MKKRLLLIVLALLLVASMLVASMVVTGCGSDNGTSTTYDHQIQGLHSFEMTAVDGRTRKYTVFVPWSYDGVTPVPVVMMLHGGQGSPEGTIGTVRWQSKAETENFLVVYPLGSRPVNEVPPARLKPDADGVMPLEFTIEDDQIDIYGNPVAWDDRWISTSRGDDVGFIDGLIDELDADYAIDLNRVYLAGISNGGMMAWRLGEELNDRLAAIASIVGCHRMPEGTVLQRNVPLISIVGDHDSRRIGDWEGGDMGVWGPYLLGLPTFMDPWQDQVDAWVTAIGASSVPEIIQDDERVTGRVYTGPGGAEFQDWRIHDMGHAWPGNMMPSAYDPKSDAIIAEDLLWDFFKRFTLDSPS